MPTVPDCSALELETRIDPDPLGPIGKGAFLDSASNCGSDDGHAMHTSIRSSRSYVIGVVFLVIAGLISVPVLHAVQRASGYQPQVVSSSLALVDPTAAARGVPPNQPVTIEYLSASTGPSRWTATWTTTSGRRSTEAGALPGGVGHRSTFVVTPTDARSGSWLTITVSHIDTPLQVVIQ